MPINFHVGTNVTIDSVVPMMGGQLTPLYLLVFVVSPAGVTMHVDNPVGSLSSTIPLPCLYPLFPLPLPSICPPQTLPSPFVCPPVALPLPSLYLPFALPKPSLHLPFALPNYSLHTQLCVFGAGMRC